MKTKGETFVMRKYNNGHKGTFKNRIIPKSVMWLDIGR